MNRGLALGLAVLLIMSAWLGISAARLKSEESALKETVKQYVTELVELSALMNESKIGGAIPNEVSIEMKAKLSDIVAKYYTDSKAAQLALRGGDSRMSGQKLIDGFDDWARMASVFHLEEAEIFEKTETDNWGNIYENYTFYVEQKGARHIEIYFSFQMKTTILTREKGSFNAYPFSSNGGGYPEVYPSEKYPDVSTGDKTENGVYKVSSTVNLSGRLIFVREGGEWKLACTQHLNAYPQSAQSSTVTGKEW